MKIIGFIVDLNQYKKIVHLILESPVNGYNKDRPEKPCTKEKKIQVVSML